jgi:putative sterol carrier protein
MPAYASTADANAVFGELFTILSQDDGCIDRLRDNNLSVRLLHSKPDCSVFMSADQLLIGDDVPDTSTITIKMSCDTAHALWSGTLMMPTAIATGKVRIRGKVSKVLELVPVLQPAFDRYPQIAAAHGVS